MYEYSCQPYEKRYECGVYDGDTVWLTVDVGFRLSFTDSFRLVGIDTPEIRTSDEDEKKRGYEARDALRNLMRDKKLKVQTTKSGKYGRWLARLLIWDESEEVIQTVAGHMNAPDHIYEVVDGGMRRLWIDAARWLIDNGYGKPYDGGKR
jgi:endonuclease YncB( thermonuclease family)